MNKKTAKVIAVITALAMVITSISFMGMLAGAYGATTKNQDVNSEEYLDKKLKTIGKFMKYVKKNYKDEVSYEDLYKYALDGTMEGLGDPYSEFYENEKEKALFFNEVSGEYEGIGVTFRRYASKNIITRVNKDGPAYKAGLKEKDLIVKVEGKDVQNKTSVQLVKLLRGKAGTKVQLTVKRKDHLLDFVVTRAKVKIENVTGKVLENNIGYIKIVSFDKDVEDEFEKVYQDLVDKKVDSVIIDVRDNVGGYIRGAIKIANYFIADSTIAQYKRQGKLLAREKSDGKTKKVLPMVMLTNGSTASASELLAGALQDNGVAKIVGTTTFGKGIAQKVIDVNEDTSAKVSIFYFETPKGNKIHGVGIKPDYPVRNISEGNEELQKIYEKFAPMVEKIKYKKGQTGLNVYAAQQRLNMLDYLYGENPAEAFELNGKMDKKTVEAIKKFQKDEKLFHGGVLDYTTMKKLEEEAYARAYGSKVLKDKDVQLEKAIEILKKK